MTTPDARATADAIAGLLRLVSDGSLDASEATRCRLEGAYIALVALAEGRAPDISDLNQGPYLHESDV